MERNILLILALGLSWMTLGDAKVIEAGTNLMPGSGLNISSIRRPRIFEDDTCEDGPFKGVCLPSSSDCEAKGGSTSGDCWIGGVCCKIVARCPPNSNPCAIRHSGTTIVSENSSTVEYGRNYRFMKTENICQVKLDFDVLELSQPGSNGICDNDSMQVNSPRGIFRICGSNSGQHVYLDFESRSYIDVSMKMTRDDSKYKIRSTFIECNSERKAPTNCLQYFTDYGATVKSFNFGNMQLSNLDYTICVYGHDGVNKIQWKPCRNIPNPFLISGNSYMGEQLQSPCCEHDWIQIFGKDRYCGNSLPTITSTAKPFMINVKFDETEGFALDLPTDPANCGGVFYDPYTGGLFECTADGSNCVCEYNPPPPPPMPLPNKCDTMIMPDFQNTGFCLEYSQM